jgi:cation diffusion facilitator family transporter
MTVVDDWRPLSLDWSWQGVEELIEEQVLTGKPDDATQEARQVCLVGWVGLIINLLLAAVKMAAGIVGNSQAVVADAVHSLSDLVTDAALIIGVRYWTAPADEQHPHGHRRIETLVALAIGLILGLVAIGLGEHALQELRRPQRVSPDVVALIGALISIVSKEALFWWTLVRGRRISSAALIANAWHHRSDSLSSIPAAAAVLVAMVAPSWSFIDAVGALMVCLFILHAAWKIMQPSVTQLIDAGAPRRERQTLESLALAVDGVVSAHALRTRYTGSKLAVDLHIEVDGELTVREGHAIGEAVRRQLLRKGPNVADCLVQVEPVEEPR